MSEEAGNPNPTPPPAPKAKGPFGKRMRKLGLLAAIVVAAAFMLDHFGVTDLGIGEGSKNQEQDKPSPNVNADPKPTPKDDGGEGESGALQQANLALRLGGKGIAFLVSPIDGVELPLLKQANFDSALLSMAALFESYDIRQFDVEIGIDYTDQSKAEVMDAINETLKGISSAANITPNQIDIQ